MELIPAIRGARKLWQWLRPRRTLRASDVLAARARHRRAMDEWLRDVPAAADSVAGAGSEPELADPGRGAGKPECGEDAAR